MTVTWAFDFNLPAWPSLGSQPLHGIHDVGLLSEKCVPEIGGPTNVLSSTG